MARLGAVRVVSCLAVALSGCATEHTLRLSTNAAETRVRGGLDREVIVFAAADARPVQTRCGTIRTMTSRAAVRCGSDVDAWLTATIVEGLYRAGFAIVTLDTATTPAPLRLRATVHRLVVDEGVDEGPDMDLSIVAQVHFTLHAHTANGLSAERSFVVEGSREVRAMVRSWYFQAAMDRVSLRIAEVVGSAVIELADRYPELGRPHRAGAPAVPAHAGSGTVP